MSLRRTIRRGLRPRVAIDLDLETRPLHSGRNIATSAWVEEKMREALHDYQTRFLGKPFPRQPETSNGTVNPCGAKEVQEK
jgi:hypothetical protein